MTNHSLAKLPSKTNFLPNVSLRDELFSPLESAFDSFFDNFFKGTTAIDRVRSAGSYPKMNVFTEDGQLVVTCAVPGIDVKDINVICVNNILKISGKVEQEIEKPVETIAEYQLHRNYYVKELSQRSFSREVVLPDWVKEQPDALLKDGILKLTWKMPDIQKKEVPKLESVPIRTG